MYLVSAAILGALVGWYMRRCSCVRDIADMQSKMDTKQTEVNFAQNELKQVSAQLDIVQTKNNELTSTVNQQSGDLKLMTSRWQATLSQAKQLPYYQKWLANVQGMYQKTSAERDKYIDLTNHYSLLHQDANKKITRLNNRVTVQENYKIQLEEMIGKVQNLNNKVTESENEIRGLYGWVSHTQNKWRHDRMDAINLRELHPKLEEQKTQAQWRLAELEKNYTEKFNAQEVQHQENLAAMQKRIDELTPLEGNEPGQNTKFSRFMDKIRLVGTSKNSVLGRTYKQIEELKLETSEKERVFVDTCEEKDAVIDDLREQVRNADNRAQASFSATLQEKASRIQELDSEVNTMNGSLSMLRENEHTIEAFKNKLKRQDIPKRKSGKPIVKPKVKAKPKKTSPKVKIKKVRAKTKPAAGLKTPAKGLKIDAATVRDDLKLIKGIGPMMEKKLNAFGVYSFEQLGRMTDSASEALSETLDSFPGRIKRDKWVPQAKTQYKKKYGKTID